MDFSTNLDENITQLQERFQGNCMIVFRYMENAASPETKGLAIFSDGLVGSSLVNDYVVKPFIGNLFFFMAVSMELYDSCSLKSSMYPSFIF